MKNDKKTIFGWCMYDWANSAYITTAAVGLLPNYFAQAVVGEAGVDLLGMNISATALWGYMLGTAAFLVFLFAPVLGAIADFSSAKKDSSWVLRIWAASSQRCSFFAGLAMWG